MNNSGIFYICYLICKSCILIHFKIKGGVNLSISSVLGKRILFLGCHLDDVEFGCGAFVAQCAMQTDISIRVHVLSDHNENAANEVQLTRNISEARKAMKILGCCEDNYLIANLPGQRFDSNQQVIREFMLKIRKDYSPDTVFFPAFGDIHQDHHTLSEEAFRIFREFHCFGYEVIRSTKDFNPNVYIEISEQSLALKTKAVMGYLSQKSESASYYFNEELIRSIAVFRGGQCGVKLAEAFENYTYQIKLSQFNLGGTND